MLRVNDYLKRIGITNLGEDKFADISDVDRFMALEDEVRFKMLEKLQLQHLLHVPFENLDVIRNVPIELDVASFYEKIVTRHRGGYCYELNGLFHWLLQQLGYDCYFVAATVLRPDGTFAMERSHATLVVELDQAYVVDVGFGDSNYQPMPLTDEVREDVSGKYRLNRVENDLYDLQREERTDSWRALQRIDMTRRVLGDFSEACHFNQTSPNSTFTKHDIVTIATLAGRYTLSDNELAITEHGNKAKQIVTSEEKEAVLKKYFEITVGSAR